ncbi:MAG: hypothetical protein M1812_000702 [Candelaria pacifica]|nr:MAG: hypothetical protein M1812_000702 [Candelaria pacifica]
MVIHRAVPQSSFCSACRRSILSSFTSIAGIPSHPAPLFGALGKASPTRISLKSKQVRAFTRSSWHCFEQEKEVSGESDQASEENVIAIPEQKPMREAVGNEQLPWYLQVQTPQLAASPLLARQSIPELPPNSPDLLQPLLGHISVDLGIDNLTMFDLRELDPPPALGANLLMVLGTARSEKHLHVSADRLCRWLRTSHKLSPFADGLLGRNELKLKMRRKARRTKLLSSVGASDRENSDDGIRTGWICVNVGRLENQTAVAEDLGKRDGIVGFGSHTGGVRVVVQMLTEGKRNEIDLEGLWGGMLERKSRREAKEDGLPHELSDSAAPDLSSQDLERQVSTLASAKLTRFLPVSNTVQPSQRRAFHSVVCKDFSATAHFSADDYDESQLPSVEPRIQYAHESNPQQDFSTMISSNNPDGEKVAHQRLADSEKSRSQGDFANAGKALTLRALLNHLKSLPREDAREILGQNSRDVVSTSFLASFHDAFPSYPSSAHWECKIEMYCHAVELGHPGYPKSSLLQLVRKVQTSAVDISEQTLQLVFETILGGKDAASSVLERQLSEPDLDEAMYVLESMSSRGYNVVTEDIFLLLFEAVYSARRIAHNRETPVSEAVLESEWEDRSPAIKKNKRKIRKAQMRLRDTMEAFKVYFTKEDSYIRILRLYAIQGDWNEFWDTWNDIARRLQPHSEALYEVMFRMTAYTGNQKKCIHVLRAWIPEMEREQPPVSLQGRVAVAVQECLLVADPWVAEEAGSESTVDGEWVKIWKTCEKALKI